MDFTPQPTKPPRLTGAAAYKTLAARYAATVSPPTANNWLGAVDPRVNDPTAKQLSFASVNEDSDGTSSTGSSMARSLRETLLDADLNILMLMTENRNHATTVVDTATELAAMPLMESALKCLDKAVERALDPDTYIPNKMPMKNSKRQFKANEYSQSKIIRKLQRVRKHAESNGLYLDRSDVTAWPHKLYICIMPPRPTGPAATAAAMRERGVSDEGGEGAVASTSEIDTVAPPFPGTGLDGQKKTIEILGFAAANVAPLGKRPGRLSDAARETRSEKAITMMSKDLAQVVDPVKAELDKPTHVLDPFALGIFPENTGATESCAGSKLTVFDESNPEHRVLMRQLEHQVPPSAGKFELCSLSGEWSVAPRLLPVYGDTSRWELRSLLSCAQENARRASEALLLADGTVSWRAQAVVRVG